MTSLDVTPIRAMPFLADLLLGSALGWATLFSLTLIPVSLALLVFDSRVLDAELLWLKPLKFQISMAVMCVTLAMAVVVAGPALAASPWIRIPAALVAVTAFYELTFLGIQAARGVRSHFNADTVFDQVGGMVMAAGAGVLVLGAAAIGAAILVAQVARGWDGFNQPLLLAIGLGLVLGGVLGGQTGGAIGANHGPMVGAIEEAGSRVPLMARLLSGGDLRIAHFLGLHAMQALPILALGLMLIMPPILASTGVVFGAGAWTVLTPSALKSAQSGLTPWGL